MPLALTEIMFATLAETSFTSNSCNVPDISTAREADMPSNAPHADLKPGTKYPTSDIATSDSTLSRKEASGAFDKIEASATASMAADKGMVIVCSAGNMGDKPWKKITPPADADAVLTVGAVDAHCRNTNFSSVGHTADGRVKPDVMARGGQATVIRPDGRVGTANGTSFAAPILCGAVACLWQACPQLTAREIIDLVRASGNRHTVPDNIYGYGIPDFWAAYLNSRN